MAGPWCYLTGEAPYLPHVVIRHRIAQEQNERGFMARTHTPTRMCTLTHMHAHTCTRTHAYTHACTHTHLHTPVRARTCACTHMHAHT